MVRDFGRKLSGSVSVPTLGLWFPAWNEMVWFGPYFQKIVFFLDWTDYEPSYLVRNRSGDRKFGPTGNLAGNLTGNLVRKFGPKSVRWPDSGPIFLKIYLILPYQLRTNYVIGSDRKINFRKKKQSGPNIDIGSSLDRTEPDQLRTGGTIIHGRRFVR